MKKLVCVSLVSVCLFAHAIAEDAMRLVATLPMPHLEDRIDHMAVDLEGQRLFVAAFGHHTLEVIDLKTNRLQASLLRLPGIQGVAYSPETKKLFATLGDDGSCRIFDAPTLKELSRIDLKEDADNIRYDSKNRRMYVGHESGAITILDAADGKTIGTIPLSAHPESFVLESNGSRIFVNIPRALTVAVVDRNQMKVIAKWSTHLSAGNFPIALDEANHRLFVGCRLPSKLLVYDTESGRLVSEQRINGDADDIFYDAKRKQLYVSCGAGYLDVIKQLDPDHYQRTAETPTATGARTALWVPQSNQLFLAVPRRSKQPAEIRIYEPTDRKGGPPAP